MDFGNRENWDVRRIDAVVGRYGYDHGGIFSLSSEKGLWVIVHAPKTRKSFATKLDGLDVIAHVVDSARATAPTAEDLAPYGFTEVPFEATSSVVEMTGKRPATSRCKYKIDGVGVPNGTVFTKVQVERNLQLMGNDLRRRAVVSVVSDLPVDCTETTE